MVRSWTEEWGQTRRIVVGVVIAILLTFAFGMAGYLVGGSSGEDPNAARSVSAAAGEQRATAEGPSKTYEKSFESGREQAFADTYPKAYERAFVREFKKAGLDAPANVSVPDPDTAQGAKG